MAVHLEKFKTISLGLGHVLLAPGNGYLHGFKDVKTLVGLLEYILK